VLQPVGQILTPVVEVLQPVGQILTPVAEVLQPVGQILTPVVEVLQPVGQILTPVVEVLRPVGEVLAPVTGSLPRAILPQAPPPSGSGPGAGIAGLGDDQAAAGLPGGPPSAPQLEAVPYGTPAPSAPTTGVSIGDPLRGEGSPTTSPFERPGSFATDAFPASSWPYSTGADPASLKASPLEDAPDSALAGGPSESPSLPSSSAGAGAAGGSGTASTGLFALLVALAAFAAHLLSRRLRLALTPWRPAAFVAVIERPG
jgi:hypothetical protein